MKLSKNINLYIYNSYKVNHTVMPVNHMKKFYKNEDKKSKESNENDKRKYKKGKDSDSEGDNNSNSTGSENENDVSEANGGISDQQKFDIHEYRKMLSEMFPSKYMDNRVSMLEKEKKRVSLCQYQQRRRSRLLMIPIIPVIPITWDPLKLI